MRVFLNLSIIFLLVKCDNKSVKFKPIATDSTNQIAIEEQISPKVELYQGDSIILNVFNKIFTKQNLISSPISIFCSFDSLGKVLDVYVDYCECDHIVKSKFESFLQQIKNEFSFGFDNYYVSQMRSGKIFYTRVLVIDRKIFSVGEIGLLTEQIRVNLVHMKNIRDCSG